MRFLLTHELESAYSLAHILRICDATPLCYNFAPLKAVCHKHYIVTNVTLQSSGNPDSAKSPPPLPNDIVGSQTHLFLRVAMDNHHFDNRAHFCVPVVHGETMPSCHLENIRSIADACSLRPRHERLAKGWKHNNYRGD